METTTNTSTVRPPVPTLVKVIAILGIIFTVIGVIAALFFIGIFLMGSGKAILLAGLPVVALSIWIGISLYKGKNWARILYIIFMGFGVLSAVLGLVRNEPGVLFGLIINLAVGGYLLLNKNVKAAFKR